MNGLLLVNLGTPTDPSTGAVRRYLAEFLWDPRVLDMPAVFRWLLLYCVILPFRPRRSAAAYAKIWDAERGSPLLFHSEDLTEAVAEKLGPSWKVVLGMRYGSPSLDNALDALIDAGCTRIFVLPLYPQYASSSTGSSLEALFKAAGERPWVPPLTVIPSFFDHPAYLDATVAAAESTVATARAAVSQAPDAAAGEGLKVLFSFHGLPERQVQATDLSKGRGHCLASPGCCDKIVPANRGCYRAQCMATARGLAQRLALSDDQWSVSFQSRLGRIPWIQPYTDHVLDAMSEADAGTVVVLTPSFVSDCLETLEEIGMEAKANYTGGELYLAPCLNTHPSWIEAVAQIVHEAAGVLPSIAPAAR